MNADVASYLLDVSTHKFALSTNSFVFVALSFPEAKKLCNEVALQI